MKNRERFTLCALGFALFVLFNSAFSQDSDKNKPGPYKLLTTIPMPNLTGFDISWVDSAAGRYYLADRGNATVTPAIPPQIDVIDTRHNKLLSPITGFVGPNGVVAIHGGDDEDDDGPNSGELWVGDSPTTAGGSSVKVVDLTHPSALPFSIPTGGSGRSDELAFDPKDRVILVANDRPADLFVTFISTKTRMILGKIKYDGTVKGNPKATGGIEQPVWDGAKGRFYLAIPATDMHSKGEVDEIDPKAMKITRMFPTTCGPAGLALIPGQRLMTSCGDVLDIATGKVLHTVTPTVSGDEIWFNPGDERVYFGGGTDRISVDVVDAVRYNLITVLTVGLIVPPVPPATFNPLSHTTHSVAADYELNRIFVPVTREGVKVYTHDEDEGEGKDD
jgi:hypothetical protein